MIANPTPLSALIEMLGDDTPHVDAAAANSNNNNANGSNGINSTLTNSSVSMSSSSTSSSSSSKALLFPLTQRRVDQLSPAVSLLMRPTANTTDNSTVILPTASDRNSSSDSPALSLLSSSSSSSTVSNPVQSRVCSTCQRAVSQYTCPRCNLCSCSLACYRQHSVACTRSFDSASLDAERGIENAIKQGIGRSRAALSTEFEQMKQQRQQTKAIMERVADFNAENDAQTEAFLREAQASLQGDDDDMDEAEAAPTIEEQQNEQRLLAALSLLEKMESTPSFAASGGDAVSNAELLELQRLLPASVLKDFHRSIVDGRMAALIERWKPWWRHDLMLETETADGSIDDAMKSTLAASQQDLTPQVWSIPSVMLVQEDEELPAFAPTFPTNITKFSTLFSGVPSPMLAIHVAEVMYAYAYVMLLHNGDETESTELIQEVMQLSPVLRGTANSTTNAGSASSDTSPPTPTGFGPTSTLFPSLVTTINDLLQVASTTPALATSCCWSFARLGDACQLLLHKGHVLRTLAHLQKLVDRAVSARKLAKRSAASSASKSDSSSSPAKLPLTAMTHKLTFLQSFVNDIWSDADRRSWTRLLYAQWEERWQTHVELHEAKAEKEAEEKRKKVSTATSANSTDASEAAGDLSTL